MAIIKNYKKGKKFSRKSKQDSQLSVNDLKHDLEIQIIKIKQKLELLQSKSKQDKKSLFDIYSDVSKDNMHDVVKALIFIDRINYQMLTEITCMNILYSTDINLDVYKTKNSVVVYKVIHKIFMLYEKELQGRNIRYEITNSDQRWNINHDILSAILLKIVQNASKYCLHDSEISVIIKEKSIEFTMISLKIKKKEKERIFQDGFVGENGKLSGKGGTGKGLFHAKKLADFHQMNIELFPGLKLADGNDGLGYARNIFHITI